LVVQSTYPTRRSSDLGDGGLAPAEVRLGDVRPVHAGLLVERGEVGGGLGAVAVVLVRAQPGAGVGRVVLVEQRAEELPDGAFGSVGDLVDVDEEVRRHHREGPDEGGGRAEGQPGPHPAVPRRSLGLGERAPGPGRSGGARAVLAVAFELLLGLGVWPLGGGVWRHGYSLYERCTVGEATHSESSGAPLPNQ